MERRPILGRSSSQANAPGGGGGGGSSAATVISPQSELNEALQQHCAITPSNSSDEIQDISKSQAAIITSNTGSGNQLASWNIQASEFVPGKTPKQQEAVPAETPVGLAEPYSEPPTTHNAVASNGAGSEDVSVFLCHLNSTLDRLTTSPGSFNEEKVNIISIFEYFATTENHIIGAAEMLVQYAIGYRPFTYDAATLCQQIALSFPRKFGSLNSTFRDYVLKAIHVEHINLDKYLQEGTKDRSPTNAANANAASDESWSPSGYRNYINGLVQFTGFLFINLVGDKTGQRLPVMGKAVRTSLLKLLRAADGDYLDTILIVLKECGRAITEVPDASSEWPEILDLLDKLLTNSVPASLLSDPSEKQVPMSNGDAPRLRISTPLRNQLRRFLDQARGWACPTPNTAISKPGVSEGVSDGVSEGVSENTAITEFRSTCFEFDPDAVDPSYIEMLPTGADSISAIPSGSAGGEQDDDEVVEALEKFAADQPAASDYDHHAAHSDAADEDYDDELESFLATIPKDETTKHDAGDVNSS